MKSIASFCFGIVHDDHQINIDIEEYLYSSTKFNLEIALFKMFQKRFCGPRTSTIQQYRYIPTHTMTRLKKQPQYLPVEIVVNKHCFFYK